MMRLRFGVTALLAMVPLQATAAEALPRVFFSPQERAEIVQRRSVAARTPPGAAVPTVGAVAGTTAESSTPAPPPAAPTVLRLEGLSVASSGATFAWISGQRYANGARLAGQRLDISAQGLVLIDANGRSRRIRVGEAINDPARVAGAKP
jgi:hypothetical protein